MIMKTNKIREQFIPIFLTILTFFGLVFLLYGFIAVLNLFPLQEKIDIHIRTTDLLVGLIIYLKTSVDFAIFIGNQMKQHFGWKNRIAIETGTALGNGLGTLIVLTIWTFFKEVPLLMVFMITLAALVLFRMAQDSLEELFSEQPKNNSLWHNILASLYALLKTINKPFTPLIAKILPHPAKNKQATNNFLGLLLFSLSIPFILGLDDFAGYIPLFSVVNIFGFSVGVFLGHMILNALLFASPSVTIKLVKQPLIMALGSIAFFGIGLWGLYEAGELLIHFFWH
jgi:hypothetical protein